MRTSTEAAPCADCPHKVVAGVACDGRYELCHLQGPGRERSTSPQSEIHDYLRSVAWLALGGEFDAVRGEA